MSAQSRREGRRRAAPAASPARAQQPAPARPPARAVRALALALLAVASLAAFAGVLGNGWVLIDDRDYVYGNPLVTRGLTLEGASHFLRWPHAANWHPVTSCSHMLDVELFGLDPVGHHATNLALHTLNGLLLAVVLFRLTGAWWRSWLVAAIFALHPLRVESVAWASERKDVLSTLFLLLTLGAYRGWVARPSAARWVLVATGLALGLMSKPMLVTLPFLLVLLDVWPLGRLRGLTVPGREAGGPEQAPTRPLAGLLLEKWPLFVLAAVSSAVTLLVQWRAGAVAEIEVVPPARRLANALVSYWRYAGMTAWPRDLAVFYPYDPGVGPPAALVAAAGLAVVTAVALRQVRRRPWLLVGWLWFLGTLVPVIGLVQVGGQAYADRYTYVPSIGLLVALVWGLAEIVPASRSARVATAGVSMALLGTLALLSARQVSVWRDTLTLFRHSLAVTGENPMGARVSHRYVGRALLGAGQTSLAIPHLEAGLGVGPGLEDGLRRRLESSPADVGARRELAALLAREDRAEEAVGEYREILSRNPDDLDALNNVAWIRATHREAGHRDGAEAVRLAERARDRCPRPLAVLHSTLAAAYAEAGRFPEAVRAGERAVELARGARANEDAARFSRQLDAYRRGEPFHFTD